MKEKIRTVFFPFFLFSLISFTVGMVVGVYLGVIEDKTIAFTTILFTAGTIPMLFIIDKYWSREKKRIAKN